MRRERTRKNSWRARVSWSGLLVVAAIAISGCAGDDRGGTASRAATDFYGALSSGQPAVACDALVDDSREKLADSEGKPCPEALSSLGLSASRVTDAEVYGRKAMVRLDNDTAFLVRETSGWKVFAAGCTEQPGRPFDCEVEAG